MRFSAGRILQGEQFVCHRSLLIDDQGRIAALDVAQMPPTHATLVPAAAWPLSCVAFAPHDPTQLSPATLTHRAAHEARTLWRAGTLEAHYVDVLRHWAQTGVSLVGLMLPAAMPADDEVTSWPGIVEACCAIQCTGLRAALVFPFDEQATRGPHFETLCTRFDRGVRDVVAQQDPRVTWAMSFVGAQPWPTDALVALRLRFAHLPLIVPVDTGDGPVGHAALSLWRERRCLDATVTFVAARAPGARERQWLFDCGCQWIDVSCKRSRYAWSRRMAAVGSAFALRAGSLLPGRWADVLSLRAQDEEAAFRWLESWPSAAHSQEIEALFVAGQRVITDSEGRG